MVLCSDILLAGGSGGASVQATFAPLMGPGETHILPSWGLVRHTFYPPGTWSEFYLLGPGQNFTFNRFS